MRNKTNNLFLNSPYLSQLTLRNKCYSHTFNPPHFPWISPPIITYLSRSTRLFLTCYATLTNLVYQKHMVQHVWTPMKWVLLWNKFAIMYLSTGLCKNQMSAVGKVNPRRVVCKQISFCDVMPLMEICTRDVTINIPACFWATFTIQAKVNWGSAQLNGCSFSSRIRVIYSNQSKYLIGASLKSPGKVMLNIIVI